MHLGDSRKRMTNKADLDNVGGLNAILVSAGNNDVGVLGGGKLHLLEH